MSKQRNKTKSQDLHDRFVNSWIKKDWKIIAGIVYLTINVFDFILFPMMFAILLPALHPGTPPLEWKPLTTSNGGLFHMAFGAILGVTVWREQPFAQAYATAAQAGARIDEDDYREEGVRNNDQYIPTEAHPLSSKYDPSIFAGPDNNSDWDGNPVQ